jgi:glycosyltransferase involved in cell wall biosynthesis
LKVLHVFPQFGPDLVNGSERYEYLLSRKLVELGIEVDVLTTRTKNSYQTSAFSSAWPHDYSEGIEVIDGMRIERFPVSFSLSPTMGHAISRSILKRWRREEERHGLMIKGSRNLVSYYHRRALERPRFYDLMMALGRGPYSLGLLRRLIKSARDYDALMVGFIPFAFIWQVIAVARFFNKPVVLLALFHPDDVYHHFRIIYWCLNQADAILAQTPYSRDLFGRLFPACKPIETGVGVDLQEFDSAAISGARFRASHGLEGTRIVLFVGRKEAFKRYDLAIQAVDLIDDERIHLVMIGRDIDQQPILSRHVSYLGEMSRSEVLDAYDACDVLMLPSEYESFGWVLLEAWARRKPVLGNRFCAPVAAVISDGEDGYLCANAAEMAQRLAELIARPSLAQKLGQAGYEKIARRYTWDVIGRRVRDLYEQLTLK